jgi:hypothetical protein
MGHGGVLSGEQVTVPAGWSISYLTQPGRNLPFFNGVGYMLNRDSLASGGFTPFGPDNGGDVIDNRIIEVLGSDERAWYAQVDPEDGSCFYAGDNFGSPAKLCETPDDEACIRGEHSCGGLFDASQPWPDHDLVWVSCQGIDASSTSQQEMGASGDTQYADFVADAANKLATLSDSEFASFYDSLTPEQVAMVMVNGSIFNWAVQREGHNFLAEHDSKTFYAMVESPSTDKPGGAQYYKDAYLADPTLKAAYEEGRYFRQAEEYLQESGQEAFAAWFRTVDQANQDLLLTDPDLSAAWQAAQGSQGGAAPVLEDGALERAAATNGTNTKALDDRGTAPFRLGGFLLLIGDGHAEADEQYVAAQADAVSGTVTIRKAGLGRGSGNLTFSSVPPAKQGVVQSAVEAFSDKDVRFA